MAAATSANETGRLRTADSVVSLLPAPCSLLTRRTISCDPSRDGAPSEQGAGSREHHLLRPVEQNRAVLQQGRALPQLGRAHELASVHEHLTSDRRREAGTGVVEGDRGWSRAVGGERRIGP